MIRKKVLTILSWIGLVASCIFIFFGTLKGVYFVEDQQGNFRIDIDFLKLYQINMIYFILGIMLFFTSIFNLIKILNEKKMIHRLNDSGIRVYAKITDIVECNKKKGFKGLSYIVKCEYYDEAEKKLYCFNSEKIWNHISEIREKDRVPVYIEVTDFSKYYVDVSSLVSNA